MRLFHFLPDPDGLKLCTLTPQRRLRQSKQEKGEPDGLGTIFPCCGFSRKAALSAWESGE
jgi:hypothetical protein